MHDGNLVHGELSRAIIGSAMEVLNSLKPGLNEKVYENALAIELAYPGYQIEQQRRFDVRYRGALVDTLVPDLIVNRLVVADPKVVDDFNSSPVAQMTGCLAITGLRLARLLNFQHADLRWKRIVR